MTKKMVVAAAMVVLVAMGMAAYVVVKSEDNLGSSAGQVIRTWKDQQETMASRQPEPLTTIIYKGGDN